MIVFLRRVGLVVGLALSLFVLSIIPAGGQGPPSWGREDFGDPDRVTWELFGEADIVEHALHLRPGSYAVYPGEWQDLGITLGVQLDEGAELAISYRFSPVGTNILVLSSEHMILMREEGPRLDELAMPVIPLPPPDPDRWQYVGLRVGGSEHTVWLNEELVLNHAESEPALPDGALILENISDALIRVDFIELGPPEDVGGSEEPPMPGEWEGVDAPWFEEEFEDGLPREGWELSENWRVTEGVARNIDSGGHMLHPGPFKDMVMHVRLRWEPGEGRVGVFFRTRDEEMITFVLFPNSMHVERMAPGTEDVDILAETDRRPGEEWHDIVIRVVGPELAILFDWELVFEERISDRSGGVGVFVDGEGLLEVDCIAVTPPEPLEALLGEEPPPPPQEPAPPSEPPAQDEEPPAGTCFVTSTQVVNIRSGPNMSYAVIATLNPAQSLQVHGRSTSNWWNVAITDQTRGWVFADIVQTRGDGCATIPVIADGTGPQQQQQPPPQQQPVTPPPSPQPGAWQTDIAVTDLFLDGSGHLSLRITNHGPGTMTNVNVPVQCEASGTDKAGGGQTSRAPVNWVFTISAAPGQTATVASNWTFDTSAFAWTVTCRSNASFDPNPGNNMYTEAFEQIIQTQIIRADLAVTDIFPQSLPAGDVYVRITNNGPDALNNATAGLNCTAVIHTYKLGDPTTTAGSSSAITVTLQPGQTKEFHSGIGIVDSTQYWHEFTCEVNLPLFDSNVGNNKYSETIPPPP